MSYLKKVYRYNKWMFCAVLLFMLLQLFFFFRGISTSPWYNSGMYSAVIKPAQTYGVYNIASKWPDNLRLLSPQWDDKIYLTLDQYTTAAENDTLFKKIKRSYSILHIPQPKRSRFFYTMDKDDFIKWFNAYSAGWRKDEYTDSTANILQKKTVWWNGATLSFKKAAF